MKLSFKFAKPWTWNCLKRKPKPIMIAVTATAISEALMDDEGLYDEVMELTEEMQEEEEEEEPPSRSETLQDELNEITNDLDELDEDFATHVAEQLGSVNSSYEIPVELENMVGASTSTSSLAHDMGIPRCDDRISSDMPDK